MVLSHPNLYKYINWTSDYLAPQNINLELSPSNYLGTIFALESSNIWVLKWYRLAARTQGLLILTIWARDTTRTSANGDWVTSVQGVCGFQECPRSISAALPYHQPLTSNTQAHYLFLGSCWTIELFQSMFLLHESPVTYTQVPAFPQHLWFGRPSKTYKYHEECQWNTDTVVVTI